LVIAGRKPLPLMCHWLPYTKVTVLIPREPTTVLQGSFIRILKEDAFPYGLSDCSGTWPPSKIRCS
jgi:hypothetical protein